MSQGDGIAPIVLDPITWFAWRQRRRANAADKAQRCQLPLNIVAARPGLLDELHGLVLLADPASEFGNSRRRVLDIADMPDLAKTTRIGDGDGNCGFVHVQPDKCADLVHGCPPSSTKVVLVGLEVFGRLGREGHDIWPSPADGKVVITPAQLGMLLEGIDWRMPRRTWRPEIAG
jgi:hypothetical protein